MPVPPEKRNFFFRGFNRCYQPVENGYTWLIGAMARREFWNLELHGIDFADAEQDGIPGELVQRQPDLRIPIDDKLARLDHALEVKQLAGCFGTGAN